MTSDRNAQIAARVASGESQEAIACDYGVSRARVAQIAQRERLRTSRRREASSTALLVYHFEQWRLAWRAGDEPAARDELQKIAREAQLLAQTYPLPPDGPRANRLRVAAETGDDRDGIFSTDERRTGHLV